MTKKQLFISFFIFVVLVFLGFLSARNPIDPDLGWHLKTGELILERGIPHQDWYSYTMPNFPWIDHEWLTDILIYKVYSFFGADFLLLCFLSVFTLSFFIVREKKQDSFIFFAVVSVGYFACINFLGIRPQLLSVFFVAILWRLICNFLDKPSWQIYILPAIFMLWTNLHAGFFAGLLILFIILLSEIIKKNKHIFRLRFFNSLCRREQSWQSILKLAIVLFVSFLTTILNPYGIRIYEEIFRTVGDNFLRFNIAEWVPLVFKFGIFMYSYIAVFVGLLVFFYKKIEINKIIVSLFFLLMALSGIRYFLIFAIITIPILTEMMFFMKEKSDFKKSFDILKLSEKKEIKLVLVLCLMIYCIFLYKEFTNIFWENRQQKPYPEKAVSFLEKLSVSENLFNDYGWGGYLIWKLPGRKFFIDGRMPSWRQNGQFVFGDYVKITEAKDGFEKYLEKYDVKIALLSSSQDNLPFNKRSAWLKKLLEKYDWLKYVFGVSTNNNLAQELVGIGWKTVYQDDVAIILQK